MVKCHSSLDIIILCRDNFVVLLLTRATLHVYILTLIIALIIISICVYIDTHNDTIIISICVYIDTHNGTYNN